MIFENVCIMSDHTDIPYTNEIEDDKSISYIIYVLSLFIQYSNMSLFYNYITKYLDNDESEEEKKVMEKYNIPLSETIDESRSDIKDIYEDINKVNLTGSTEYRSVSVKHSLGGLVKQCFTELELEYISEVYNDYENRYSQTIIYTSQNMIRFSRFEEQNDDVFLTILTLNLTFDIKNNDDNEKNIRFRNILTKCINELKSNFFVNEKIIESKKTHNILNGFIDYILIGFIVCLYAYFMYASIF